MAKASRVIAPHVRAQLFHIWRRNRVLGRTGGGGPLIDMNFATSTYSGGTLGNLLTVSRALAAYGQSSAGVLTSFATDVPRVTDQGLLIEETRTNLALQSQTFGTSWTMTSGALTADTTAAPDGTTTADTYTAGGTSTQHSMQPSASISFTNGTTYTASIYAKFGSAQFAQITMGAAAFAGSGYANFDLVNGTVTATGGTLVGATISALANGWYRLTFTATATSTSSTVVVFAQVAAGNSARLAASPANGTTIWWGAQLEAGSFASSYIPTTTVSVARPADVITPAGAMATLLAGSAWTAIARKLTAPTALATILGRGANVGFGYTSTPGARSTDGTTALNATGLIDADITAALAISASGRSLVYRGGTAATDSVDVTSASLWSRVGSHTSGDFFNDYLMRLAFY
jgi:hypothetical protein